MLRRMREAEIRWHIDEDAQSFPLVSGLPISYFPEVSDQGGKDLLIPLDISHVIFRIYVN